MLVVVVDISITFLIAKTNPGLYRVSVEFNINFIHDLLVNS